MIDFELFYFIPLYGFFLLSQILLKVKGKDLILRSLLFIYSIGVLSVTLFPIPFQGLQDFIDQGMGFSENWIPFASIVDTFSKLEPYNILRQLGGNIILFVPLGFLWPYVSKRKINWKRILWVGFWTSFCIESTQFGLSHILGFSYKITDVDDLILNVLGTCLGYICYRFFEWGRE